MRTLIIIPARAGSKGLPGKNIKLLGCKPLISHTIEFALSIRADDDVLCISTDDDQVIDVARNHDIVVPFKRPAELASDTATTYDVIMHALSYYEAQNDFFDAVLLLQPTSPLRIKEDFTDLLNQFDGDCDMVVTVKIAKENPYYTLFEENDSGYIEKSKKSNFNNRQDCPPIYAYNGSMYLISAGSLKASNFQGFSKIKKVVMPDKRSIDIDYMSDWILAEYFLNE